MWDLPVPGLKPVSPELAGGFLTTAPPGKPNQTVVDLQFAATWMDLENIMLSEISQRETKTV